MSLCYFFCVKMHLKHAIAFLTFNLPNLHGSVDGVENQMGMFTRDL